MLDIFGLSMHARSIPRICKLLLVLSSLLAFTSGTALAGNPVRSGHAGHWYSQVRDGEGWVLELIDADTALLYWFTYDEDGGQRWMTAVGHVTGNADDERIEFPELIVTRGARFGEDFDPASVVRERVGSARMEFLSCDAATLSYSAFGQSETISVGRLAHVMGGRCETPHGVTGREVASHAGLSGSWFDPSHNGEGYALQWINPNQAIITWYSYDDEGRQFWMLGVGGFDGTQMRFDLHATRGARFGEAFDPKDVERFNWGELVLDINCTGGTATFDSTLPVFGAGELALTRLTGLHEIGCPWQKPRLSNLFEVGYRSLSLPRTSLGTTVMPRWILNDGTVFGTLEVSDAGERRQQLVRLASTAQQWEHVPDGTLGDQFEHFVSSDGTTFLTHRYRFDDQGELQGAFPVVRQEALPWAAVPGLELEHNYVTATSHDLRWLAGAGTNDVTGPGGGLWLWNQEAGLVARSMGEEYVHPMYPPLFTGISEDGRVAIGTSYTPTEQGVYRTRALRWVDDAGPEPLFDSGGHELRNASFVSADGGTIFGTGQAIEMHDHGHDRQPWYWKSPGEMRYLGTLNPELPEGHGGVIYAISTGTTDGNMVAGAYVSGSLELPGFPPFQTIEAMVWSEHTGLLSIAEVIDESGSEAEPWTERSIISMSDDGEHILLIGVELDSQARRHSRVAVLHLEPKW